MNIAVVTSSFPENSKDASAAAGLFVRDFCIQLARRGHAVTVLTQRKGSNAAEAAADFEVHWYEWRGGDKPVGYLRLYRPADLLAAFSLIRSGTSALRALHRRQRFDHVIAMWAVPSGFFAQRLQKSDRVPYTVWCLGSDIWKYGRIPILKTVVARVLRGAAHIFADGTRLCDEVTRLSGLPCRFLPSSRMLMGSGTGIERTQEDYPRFLFVGRYAPVKGLDVLLEAFALYKNRGGAGHLYAFGGGPDEASLRRRAAFPDVKDHVTLGGWLDDSNYLAQIRACDFMIIPSRMESIPLVLSDAVQAGKPVIVSDVGDMGAMIRKTPAGIVVPSEDPEALARALRRMADDGAEHYTPEVDKLASEFGLPAITERLIQCIQAGAIAP